MLKPFNCLTVLFALGFAATAASAGTITLTSIYDPAGNTTNASSGSSMTIPDGNDGSGFSWNNVAAEVFTNSGTSDLEFFGHFSCASQECDDTFYVNFEGTGFSPSSTSYVSMFGTATTENIVSLSAYVGNSTVFGSAQSNRTGPSNVTEFFSASSTPTVIALPSDFFGVMEINIDMAEGTLNLPAASTADLFLTPISSVPEPGSLAIVAACGLLLFYVKRLRKA